MQRKIWLVAEPISKTHGLSIGCRSNSLEIFQKQYPQSEERYYLANRFPPPSTITTWLRPSNDFLQKTLTSLPENHQEKFKSLVDGI